jgi:hypothetical protein
VAYSKGLNGRLPGESGRAGYLALSAIDAGQTIHCLDRGICEEGNPIFGKHPSAKKLILAKVGLGALHFVAFKALNDRNPRAALRLAQVSCAVQGGVGHAQCAVYVLRLAAAGRGQAFGWLVVTPLRNRLLSWRLDPFFGGMGGIIGFRTRATDYPPSRKAKKNSRKTGGLRDDYESGASSIGSCGLSIDART